MISRQCCMQNLVQKGFNFMIRLVMFVVNTSFASCKLAVSKIQQNSTEFRKGVSLILQHLRSLECMQISSMADSQVDKMGTGYCSGSFESRNTYNLWRISDQTIDYGSSTWLNLTSTLNKVLLYSIQTIKRFSALHEVLPRKSQSQILQMWPMLWFKIVSHLISANKPYVISTLMLDSFHCQWILHWTPSCTLASFWIILFRAVGKGLVAWCGVTRAL